MKTGSTQLDLMLGGRGWLPGHVYEVHGKQGLGKTSICLMFLRSLTHAFTPIMLCSEALDTRRIEESGLDPEITLLCTSPFLEDMKVVLDRITTPSAIVIDSTSHVISDAEDLSMFSSDNPVSNVTRELMRILLRCLRRSNSVALVTSQVRSNMQGRGVRSTADAVLSEYCYCRFRLDDYGEYVRLTTTKDPITIGNQWSEVKMTPYGIDPAVDMMTACLRLGIVTRDGSWYSFRGTTLGHGLEQSTNILFSEYAQQVHSLLEVS